MALLVLAFLFSWSSRAVELDLSRWDVSKSSSIYSSQKFTATYSRGLVWDSKDKFPILERPLKVILPAGSIGYSHPKILTGNSKDPKYRCQYPKEMNGDLLYVSEGVAAVRLNSHVGCAAGKLNSGEGIKDVVFFKTDQIKTTGYFVRPEDSSWREEDAQTEAVIKAPKPSPLQKRPTDGMDPLVKEFMKEQEEKSRLPVVYEGPTLKSREEMGVFMRINCTKYQPDYELVYSKLIDLTQNAFTLVYYVGPGNKRRTEAYDPENSPFESQTGPLRKKEVPLFIEPDTRAMRCIARRESRWDAKATSSTGAVGIGQQTSINLEDVKNAVDRFEWARVAWNRFYDEAEKAFPPKQYPKLYRNQKTGKPCHRSLEGGKEKVGYCPVSSIGAAALYQVLIENDIHQVVPDFDRETRSLTPTERLELIEVLATSHNAGRTVARDLARKTKIKNWGQMISRMKGSQRGDKGREVREYHKMMENCLTAGAERDFAENDGMDDCRQLVKKNAFSSRIGLENRIHRDEIPIPKPRPDRGQTIK